MLDVVPNLQQTSHRATRRSMQVPGADRHDWYNSENPASYSRARRGTVHTKSDEISTLLPIEQSLQNPEPTCIRKTIRLYAANGLLFLLPTSASGCP
jgi:hypothetical protein